MNMKHKLSLLLLALTLTASTGCATIMAGGPDAIPVSSQPPGATVILDGQPVGSTPMTVILNRETSQGMLRFEMQGYQPVAVQRIKAINGWFWGNLCIGGPLGMIIDLVTGDYKAFDNAAIHVNMVPAGGAPAGGGFGGAAAPQANAAGLQQQMTSAVHTRRTASR